MPPKHSTLTKVMQSYKENQKMTVEQRSDAMGLNFVTVYAALHELLEKNLMSREPVNKRQYTYSLTEKGHKSLDALKRVKALLS